MIHNRAQAERANDKFFSRSAIKFFSSRIGKFYPIEGGAFFVTSERFDSTSERRYTVRFISDEGTIRTLGSYLYGFQKFPTSYRANRYAKALQEAAQRLSGAN